MVVMIMLNMVLAIVLDIYNEVRAATDSTDTIFLFMSQVFTQLRHFKSWIGHKEMQCMFAEAADDASSVKVDDLLEAFPNMTVSQRKMLMTACKLEMMWQAKTDLVASNFLKLGASIKLSVDDASTEITEVDHLLFTNPEPMSPVKPPGKSLTTPPTTPRTTPRRMVGVSRPFPGIPSTPGGHFPPMRMQKYSEESINLPSTSRKREGDEPDWYGELRKKMASSGELMDACLSDLRTFHFWWSRMLRATPEGQEELTRARLARKQSLVSLSEMKMIGGRPVL